LALRQKGVEEEKAKAEAE
jgi:hypothetical protein